MIIRYPTGLYGSVLPREPQQAGDVTFTISSTDPPRAMLLFPKLPPGVNERRRDQRTTDMVRRRAGLDNLLFTIQKTNRSANASATKQYEVGQLLEFGDRQPVRTLDPNLAGTYSEIRHDTGLLDYVKLGIGDDLRAIIAAESDATYRRLEVQLADARQQYSAQQVSIAENQKLLTETAKALGALAAMGSGDVAIATVIDNLRHKRVALNRERGQLVNLANDTAKVAAAILQKLRDLAQVVR